MAESIANKACSKCKQTLPCSSFSKNKQQPSGLDPQCKECKRAQWAKRKSERLAAGLCIRCGVPARPSLQTCTKCSERDSLLVKKKTKRRRDQLLCVWCGSKTVNGAVFCELHRSLTTERGYNRRHDRVSRGLCSYASCRNAVAADRLMCDYHLQERVNTESARYFVLVDSGLCGVAGCGEPHLEGKTRCSIHHEKQAEAQRLRSTARFDAGLCVVGYCENERLPDQSRCEVHRDQHIQLYRAKIAEGICSADACQAFANEVSQLCDFHATSRKARQSGSYRQKVDLGICTRCPEPAIPNASTCVRHHWQDVARATVVRAFFGTTKLASTRDLLGLGFEEFTAYIRSQFTPVVDEKTGLLTQMTDTNHGVLWHIDHYWPLSRIDFNNEIERRKVCHYTNLRPLGKRENMLKGDSIPAEIADPAQYFRNMPYSTIGLAT